MDAVRWACVEICGFSGGIKSLSLSPSFSLIRWMDVYDPLGGSQACTDIGGAILDR